MGASHAGGAPVPANTDEENCIGCRLCEYICPSQIIRVTLRKGDKRENGIGGTYADHFSLDYQACMQCELCVQVCPTDAIVMTRYLAECPYSREGMFLSKERLMEHGRRLLAQPIPRGERLVVRALEEDGPADRAGIRRYDVLLSLGGRPLGHRRDLRRALIGSPVEGPVPVVVLREGEHVRLSVSFGD